jgi:hypothetical protein
VDLNRLYFDHQLALIKADEAATAGTRRRHQGEAARIAACIGDRQRRLGAAAASTWEQPA